MTGLKRLLLTALVAVTPVFTACERVDEISSVTTDASFSFNEPGTTTTSGAPGTDQRLGGELLRRNAPRSGTNSIWLTKGTPGTLSVEGYSLHIPRGAVRGPSQFTMTLVPVTDETGTYELVRLKAYTLFGEEIKTFSVPLRLTIAYDNADAEQLSGTRPLNIAYVADGSTTVLEVIGAADDRTNLKLTGFISHFSDYTPILD